MTAEKEYLQALELCKQVVQFMENHKIPALPKCYDVWYQYLAKENPDLVKAITDFLDKDGTLDYVDMVSDLLARELTGVNNSFANGEDEIGAFKTMLNNAKEKCAKAQLSAEVKEIADTMITGADKMSETVSELKNHLEASKNEIKKLKNYLETVRQETNVDVLTGLMSRRRFDQVIAQMVREAIESDEPLSLLALRIDHYEAFKEKWGQITAEQILCFSALTIKDNIKGKDKASRYSNELFVIALPKTERAGAKALAEHIRGSVERKRVVKKNTGEYLGRVTLSGGVAQFVKGESIGVLMNRLNRALEVARMNGDNYVVTDTDSELSLGGAASGNNKSAA
jgi:diguanylate cyclase